MTLTQLIAAFRTDADDAAAPYLWSDTEVTGWLNEAQDEAAIRGKLIFESSDTQICNISVTALLGSVYATHASIHEIVYASLTDSSGVVTKLELKDRIELDRIKPDWRTCTDKPEYLIHQDKSIRLAGLINASYTVKLEVHRLPKAVLATGADVPEINSIHHATLVDWALYRAYLKPDSETLSPGKAQDALARFTDYFGERPNAQLRKDENANRQHVNKTYW